MLKQGPLTGVRVIELAGLAPVPFAGMMRADLGADVDIDFQLDRASGPQWRKVLGEKFREKTRDEWEAIFADVDACVSPVLTPRSGA